MRSRLKFILLVSLAALSVQGASPLAKNTNVNARQADGMTALHWAAQREDAALTKQLLQSGADARATNRYGITPLALACEAGNGPIVEMLLDAGADPNTSLR